MDELVGRRYFGVLTTTAERVDAFVAATGDDAARWSDHAPPGFAAAALFAVAPALLDDFNLEGVLHTEQRFNWASPFSVGDELDVVGEVKSVRERSGVVMVGFSAEATRASQPVVSSNSTFLVSATGPDGVDPDPEPAPDAAGDNDGPLRQELPGVGEVLPPLHKSASRTDLVRYAEASGDLNPIHTDHDAAVGAGLSGIIVHGLLMVSWIVQQAGRFAEGPMPVTDLRARFKNPLRPGVQAVIEGSVGESDSQAAKLVMRLSSDSAELVTATTTIRVTP